MIYTGIVDSYFIIKHGAEFIHKKYGYDWRACVWLAAYVYKEIYGNH